MGSGTGLSGYKASVVTNSDLPSLLCLNSVRDRTGVLHTGHDALYLPDEAGADVYRRMPLDYDGIHYSIPIDRIGDEPSATPLYQLRTKELEKYADGGAKVWMSWVLHESQPEEGQKEEAWADPPPSPP